MKRYISKIEEAGVNRIAYVGDATPLMKEDGIYEVYLKPHHLEDGAFIVYIFAGKSQKPYAMYKYSSMAKAGAAIDKFVDEIKQSKAKKDKAKEDRGAQKKVNFDKIKIDDIFFSSWGYDQTNVEFYQVIEKKASTVVVREIAKEQVQGSESFMSANVKPIKDHFVGNPFVARVDAYGITGGDIYDGAWFYDKGDKGVYSSWYA